jgi:hypothetical protein
MVARLKEVDAAFRDSIHEPMLLRMASRFVSRATKRLLAKLT